MSNDSKNEQPARRSSRKRDDLTIIRGIGEALERWFRQSFKVVTYADLAALSCVDVEARAREQGQILSRNKIEQILAHAGVLAVGKDGETQTRATPSSRTHVDKPLPTRPDASGFSGRSSHRPSLSAGEQEWQEIGTFMVYFERRRASPDTEHKTTVHRMETGEQAEWRGLDVRRTCGWMRERLGESKTTRSGADVRPGGTPSWTVRIGREDAVPVADPARPARADIGVPAISAHSAFVIEIVGHAVTAGSDDRLHLLVRRLDTNALVFLGHAMPVPEASDSCATRWRLDAAGLPAGDYDLICLPAPDLGTVPSFVCHFSARATSPAVTMSQQMMRNKALALLARSRRTP